MHPRVTQGGGITLEEWIDDVVGDFETVRELVCRTDDIAAAKALEAILRMTRAQVGTVLGAFRQGVGEVYISYDGCRLDVRLDCKGGGGDKCIDCGHLPQVSASLS